MIYYEDVDVVVQKQEDLSLHEEAVACQKILIFLDQQSQEGILVVVFQVIIFAGDFLQIVKYFTCHYIGQHAG